MVGKRESVKYVAMYRLWAKATSENMGLTKNPSEAFRRKKLEKRYSRHLWNNPVEHKGPTMEELNLDLATRWN